LRPRAIGSSGSKADVSSQRKSPPDNRLKWTPADIGDTLDHRFDRGVFCRWRDFWRASKVRRL